VLEPKLVSKLEGLEARAEELSGALAQPDITSDLERYRQVSRSYAELEPVIATFREYRGVVDELDQARVLVEGPDPEMRAMAAEEARTLSRRADELAARLRVLLLPSDPNDARNVVLEIRAGTGGDEATLFAAELYRMYTRYAESLGWRVQTTDLSESDVGGVKEVIALLEGDRVYSRLKFESGVHRVQRVPETEAQGRIHTSAVTVAVLPEAEEVEVDIEDKELRIDSYCAQGAGGQHVNRTQSAVRIVHLPTNLVVQCQDEKSWHKNKARAMQVLRSRLYDMKLREQQDEIARERKGMVGTGDRSEKIRTYNFPQNRVTDHRIGLTLHSLPAVMDGDLEPLIEALVAQDRAERLRQEVEV